MPKPWLYAGFSSLARAFGHEAYEMIIPVGAPGVIDYDQGTQYRSAIYPLTPEQTAAAQASLARFQAAMTAAGDERAITTEITTATPFYYAEDDHQQYLHKNPYGYCGIGGIGVCLPPER